MAYCGPRGIPHWHFLGGPPGWTAHDRQAALWWFIEDRRKCPNCRTDPDDWDPDKGGRLTPYEAKKVHCHGCQVLAEAQDEQERLKVKPRPGESITLAWVPEEPEVTVADDRDRDG